MSIRIMHVEKEPAYDRVHVIILVSNGSDEQEVEVVFTVAEFRDLDAVRARVKQVSEDTLLVLNSKVDLIDQTWAGTSVSVGVVSAVTNLFKTEELSIRKGCFEYIQATPVGSITQGAAQTAANAEKTVQGISTNIVNFAGLMTSYMNLAFASGWIASATLANFITFIKANTIADLLAWDIDKLHA